MPYSSYLTPRKEVLTPEGVNGIIDVANIASDQEGKIEAKPELFFNLTYPTSDIKRVLEQINLRFNSKKASAGLFLFEALKGSGKSHLLLLIYNLFKYREIAEKWLANNQIDCVVPEDDFVVVLNKFTDNPESKIWNMIFEKLGVAPEAGPTHPKLKDFEKALGKKKIVLIFDELEQGIRCISDPALQAQNIAFLQMLSEYGNRSKNVTVFASIYSDREEPGSTLKRVSRCTVQLNNPKDRNAVILHRLFENWVTLDKSQILPVIASYLELWKKHCSFDPEIQKECFLQSYPFTPSLMEIVQKRIPSRGGFQNVRGSLEFLGNLVRLTWNQTDIITPGDASLDDKANTILLRDLDIGGEVINRAFENSEELKARLPLSKKLSSCVLLYTLTGVGGTKGALKEELCLDILSPAQDINQIELTLQGFSKYASYFHSGNGRYYFDLQENSEAKIEAGSLRFSDHEAYIFLCSIYQEEIFRDCSCSVIYNQVDTTKERLKEMDKNRLRFILSTRLLTQEERHNLYFGIENRNLLILIEPKDTSFNMAVDKDLLKWVKRIMAAKPLLNETEDSSKKADYEKIKKNDLGNILDRIKKAGFVFLHWENYGELISDDLLEREPLSCDGSKDKILERLSQDYFPEITMQEHIESRLANIKQRLVKEVRTEYISTLSFPVPVYDDRVTKALIALCRSGLIGIQHSHGNYCRTRPDLSDAELMQARIVDPFEDKPRVTQTTCPRCSSLPCKCVTVSPEPALPGSSALIKCPQCNTSPCICKKAQEVRERILPCSSLLALRQALAFKLEQYENVKITRIQYKIFLEKPDLGDLAVLPQSLRGSLTGRADLTAEIVITKTGILSKAELEQQVEKLPLLPEASYSADILLETEMKHGS